MIDHLFVYGTLRHGCDNEFARLLEAGGEYLGPARISGRLYGFDWHPGAVEPEGPEDIVRGDVFHLSRPDAILARLDEYEGPEFERAGTVARLDSGRSLEAWVYLYRGPKKGARILSGDWLADRPPASS